MKVPPLDLSRQHAALLPEMLAAFEATVTAGQFVLGPAVEAFESTLADYCGAGSAMGMSSGTDALLAALTAFEIGPGDEVLTTPFTFYATASCIARLGATPVFVDIEPQTLNLDPTRLEAAVTGRTRAIIAVHLYGQMADMDAISEVAGKHGLKLIEDVAQAIGAQRCGRSAGAAGDVGCFSFYPTKNLSALGDAGACTTDDPALAQRLKTLRVHGDLGRYQHRYLGGNFRLDALQATMLSIKFPHLDAWNEARRQLAQRYDALLEPLPVVTPYQAPQCRHVFHQYTIRVPDDRRDALTRHLADQVIGFGIHYPIPLHLQEALKHLGYHEGDFPVAEQAARQVLCLPIFPGMTAAEQDDVVAAIGRFYG